MKPALRRAIIRANPDYFQMPIAQQELYRVTIPDEHDSIIERQLYRDLFGISDDQEVKLDNAQLNAFNESILPIRGIGDDYIWLNTGFGDKTILDFNTFYDYDIDDHHFQEEAKLRVFPDHEERPYRGGLHCVWARLFVDSEFNYANINSAAGYLFDHIFDASTDCVQDLIPYRLVPGKNHGSRQESGFLFNMQKDAGGKEAQLEELIHRSQNYIIKRRFELADLWFEDKRCEIYLIDRSENNERHIDIIFSDPEAMKTVRFQHFIKDCRAVSGKASTLVEKAEHEKNLLETYLAEQLADIEANFDPKVTKLRKRRKLIFSSQAMEDLENLSDES